MDLSVLASFFGWCSLVNLGLLLFWFLVFWLAHGWVYQFHRKIAVLSVETFDAIHYSGMAAFKMIVIVFNLVPYIVLRIMQ